MALGKGDGAWFKFSPTRNLCQDHPWGLRATSFSSTAITRVPAGKYHTHTNWTTQPRPPMVRNMSGSWLNIRSSNHPVTWTSGKNHCVCLLLGTYIQLYRSKVPCMVRIRYMVSASCSGAPLVTQSSRILLLSRGHSFVPWSRESPHALGN